MELGRRVLRGEKVVKAKILKYLWVAVFAGVAVYFGIYIYQMVKILGSPYGLEYGDGWNAYIANWWGKGGLNYIYPPVDRALPFFNMPYTPLYYLIVGTFYPLTGPVFWVGRVVSILAAFGTSFLFFLIVKRLTGSKWWGIVAAILFFMPPVVRAWSLWFKVEPLALFFSFLGLYLVVRFNGTRRALWCVLPFLLAIYTKQTYISAAVAAGIYFLITNRRLCLQYSVLMLLGGGATLGLFQFLTNGNFIPSIFAAPSGMPKSWQLSAYLMGSIVIYHWVIIILALCTVMFLVRKRRWSTPTILFAFYFLVATVVLAGISTKAGGWLSYSYEMLPAAMILIPVLAWEFSRSRSIPVGVGTYPDYGFYKGEKHYSLNIKAGGNGASIFQFLVPVLLVIQLFILPSYFSWSNLPKSTFTDYQVVLSYLEKVPKDIPVYSEVEELMIWTGREPLIEPSVYSQRVINNKVDGLPFLRMVENKELGLIIQEWDINSYWEVTSGEHWPNWLPEEIRKLYTAGRMRSTDELAAAVRDNYQLVEHVGKFWVYEPKP